MYINVGHINTYHWNRWLSSQQFAYQSTLRPTDSVLRLRGIVCTSSGPAWTRCTPLLLLVVNRLLFEYSWPCMIRTLHNYVLPVIKLIWINFYSRRTRLVYNNIVYTYLSKDKPNMIWMRTVMDIWHARRRNLVKIVSWKEFYF